MTKYIFVTGGVISGLGKGITASSIGLIFKAYGYRVSAIKIDPYLNIDCDTMSPFEHGEAYVLDDGCVTDLDLGNYERFLNIRLSGDHSLTSGKIFNEVLKKERRGDYLGKTVQFVPHVTDFIQEYISRVAQIPVGGGSGGGGSGSGVIESSYLPPEIVIVELGGTIGDIESAMYTEAISQFTRTKLNDDDYCFVHVSLIVTTGKHDEIKTKPTQHSLKEVRRQGIYPDLLILRSKVDLEEQDRNKISNLCQIRKDHVIVNRDVKTIYDVPRLFLQSNVHNHISKKLNLSTIKKCLAIPKFEEYNSILSYYDSLSKMDDESQITKIGIVGKYTNMQDTYLSLIRAIEMASVETKVYTKIVWISSELPTSELSMEIGKVDKIIIPGGFGVRGIEGMIDAVTIARERNIPLLGICLGCQILAIEFARNMCNLRNANSVEFDKDTQHPVIVPCADTDTFGGTMRLGSILVDYSGPLSQSIYNSTRGNHRFRHRYVINDKYIPKLSQNGLGIDGFATRGDKGREQGLISNISISYPNGTTHIGVQYHPELAPRPDEIFKWFLKNKK